ncbi:transposase [Fulvimarina pelagi]
MQPVYSLVFPDKIRDKGLVRNKAVHIAFGVLDDGRKETH